MNCENRLCVYWRENLCILDKIEIDSLGMCSACILVDIAETQLRAAREAFLRREDAADASE